MPRVNFDVTEETMTALNKLLPHGTKKLVFCQLIDDLIEAAAHDSSIVGKILNNQINFVRDNYDWPDS
jgi:hypothetical protein